MNKDDEMDDASSKTSEEPESPQPSAVEDIIIPSAESHRWWRPRRPGRKLTIALAIVAGLLVAGAAGAAYAAYDLTQEYEGRILPGTTLAGVDVGGLTRDEALDAVQSEIRPQLERTVTLNWSDRTWETTPEDLGARSDAVRAVDAALDASSDASFIKRMRMAVLDEDLGFERRVAITHPRQEVHGFIEGIASGLDGEVRDATVDYSSGWVKVVPEKEGREVQVDKSRRALMRTLRSGAEEATLSVRTTEPTVTRDEFDEVLLLRIGENKLYLYEDGEITHSWVVATGQPEYPTPVGIYEVTEKRYMPTWVNPDPEGWGASMPLTIPPGEGNPLGVRALNWSAEAIRFHGTSATYSLGYNASHGCVRLSNSDVIALYDMIDVGTPIVSTVVASLRPLYVSAPDPTVVAEDEGDEEPTADAGDAQERKADSPGGKDKKDA